MKTENKVLSISPKEAINAKAHRKEGNFQSEYCIIDYSGKEVKTPITLRIYGSSSNSANYACLWIHGEFKGMKGYQSFNGSDRATGCGYHRPSAAAAYAIKNAGIELKNAIDGRGETAIEDALKAIASYLGIKNSYLHYSHA